MSDVVRWFNEVDSSDLDDVGGKGANLGEMTQAGFAVPNGFCVSTRAFTSFIEAAKEEAPALVDLLYSLDTVDDKSSDGVAMLRSAAKSIREILQASAIDEEVSEELLAALATLNTTAGEAGGAGGPGGTAVAVRSSATQEDLDEASFAGQQETYLNVKRPGFLQAVKDCWASLYTDRAVLYRRQTGFKSGDAKLSVVVQKMAAPKVAGIMFSADPVTGHRGHCTIDASYGLGEALVSGIVTADLYHVDKASGEVLDVRIGEKALAIVVDDSDEAAHKGGTKSVEVDEDKRAMRVLSDDDCRRLSTLARNLEQHYGKPQDVEWAIEDDGTLMVLQTRPITSLFPMIVNESGDDDANDEGMHVFASFGHQQVMTEPFTPFGYGVIQHAIPLGKTPVRPVDPQQPDALSTSTIVRRAGWHVYLDLTPALLTFPVNKIVVQSSGAIDPLMPEIVRELVAREEFTNTKIGKKAGKDDRGRARLWWTFRNLMGPVARKTVPLFFLDHDEETERKRFIDSLQGEVDAAERRISQAHCLSAALASSRESVARIAFYLLPVFPPAVIVGTLSWKMLLHLTRGRLAESVVEDLTRGFVHNVTTQMDLELGDMADIARMHPPVRALVEKMGDQGVADSILDALAVVDGGPLFVETFSKFIERYGHRGPSEIDAGRPRWKDDAASLWTSLRGMLASDIVGAHREREQRAIAQAADAEVKVVEAASYGVFPFAKTLRKWWAKRLVKNVRTFLGLREHGKFFALKFIEKTRDLALDAGKVLVDNGSLDEVEDVFYLTLDEVITHLDHAGASGDGVRALVRELVATRKLERQAAFKRTPPRVLTSTGEAPVATLHGDLPAGALGGLGASSGVVRGIARVIMDPATDVLHAGEILVAPFTDPGWTPLFVHAAGLVTNVGGMMTHGSVVAREYGIPAVVGVDAATARISTGDHICVDGSTGVVTFVES